MNYDVIGDIHGQAGKLETMLSKLGYVRTAQSWVPPQDHQAVFVGDLIDRGPEQLKVVDMVRRMVDAGNAHCVLGNHELNAIAYTVRREGTGEFLRTHSAKNEKQHREFLQQVDAGSATHVGLVDWFRTLPPALDLGAIRVVHAWWNDEYVDLVGRRLNGKTMDDEFMHLASTRGTPEWAAMEGMTKGLEIALPEGSSFTDHEGVERREVRARWWLEKPRTYREYAQLKEDQRHRVPAHPLPADTTSGAIEGSPVFIGHYWMEGTPVLQAQRVACVDYSAAKDGQLVCYRWQGEAELTDAHFVEAA